MKYNLGAGLAYKKGYINVDIDEKVNPDVVADIDIIPWVWVKGNSADRIEMNNLAEHLKDFIGVIKECHWVLKNKGILWIKVPFLKTIIKPNISMLELLESIKEFIKSVEDCVSDPTHVGLKFTTRTFEYFDCNRTRWKNFGQSYGIPKFKLVKQQIKDRFLIIGLEVIK